MVYSDLFERVRDILLHPDETWSEVRDEPATPRDLYLSYACILAAIPAVCQFIGMTLVGYFFLGIHYRAPILGALGNAVASYCLSLAALYLFAIIINALAPSFGSHRDLMNALKLAIYSSTPAWVTGVLFLYPALAVFALLLSLYSFYLLFAGLPHLMGTPRERRPVYFIVLVIASFLVTAVAGFLANLMFPGGRMGIM